MKLTFKILGLVLVLAAATLQLSGHGYIWRALTSTYLQGYSTANIDDAKNFDQRVIPKGETTPWPKEPRYNQKQKETDTLAYLK